MGLHAKQKNNPLKCFLNIYTTACMFVFTLCLLSTGCTTENPNRPKPTEHDLTSAANTNIELGYDYIEKGELARAKQRILMAFNEAPKNAGVQDALGYFYEVTGELQTAEAHYLHAISLAPKSGEPYNNYGTFLCRQKRYTEADQQFSKAVSIKSYLNTGQAYENAGICALAAKNFAVAKQNLTRALEYNPNSFLALSGLVQLYSAQKNPRMARFYLAKLDNIAPTDPITKSLDSKILPYRN
jgi:type IV pilus assembly protein PilF